MKTIGIIGGMSWESTVTYYQEINRRVRQVKGGLHSAHCIVYSVDFAEIEEYQQKGDWESAGVVLADAATQLTRAGAQGIVLATNTMHLVVDHIEKALAQSENRPVPLIHIVDSTAEKIVEAGFETAGLLGTRYVMEKEFFRARLEQKFGLKVVVPAEDDRAVVNNVIFSELCNGVIKDTSRLSYQRIIAELARSGADCLILGCTEIGLLVNATTSELPMFDTAQIHAVAAADWAMKDSSN